LAPWASLAKDSFPFMRFFIGRFRLSQLGTDIEPTQIQWQIELRFPPKLASDLDSNHLLANLRVKGWEK